MAVTKVSKTFELTDNFTEKFLKFKSLFPLKIFNGISLLGKSTDFLRWLTMLCIF